MEDIRGTAASSSSKSTLMLLLASMLTVTPHAKLWYLNLTAPTTSPLITELASHKRTLTLLLLNTKLINANLIKFMVYQEDPSMLLLVLDALDSVVLVGTVGSVEASSEKDMEEPGMEDLRAVEEV